MNSIYDNLSNKQRKSIDRIATKFTYLFYFIPSLMLYSFVYDITHQVAHWSSRYNQYGRSPAFHFLGTFVFFIFITGIIWAYKKSVDPKTRTSEIFKVILLGILIMTAYLPLIYLMNRNINPW